MTPRDLVAAQTALIEWMRSQQIDPLDAALLMVMTAGQIVGCMSIKDPVLRHEALHALHLQMITDADVD